MKWKKYNQLLRKLRNEQLYFIDASVVLEIIFDQPRKEEWLNFLSQFKCERRKGVLSNFTTGEIVRNIYYFESKFYKEYDTASAMKILNELIGEYKLIIWNINKETGEIARNIMDEDSRMHFEDALNVAFANQEGCVCFCTLDSEISRNTLQNFKLKRIEHGQK